MKRPRYVVTSETMMWGVFDVDQARIVLTAREDYRRFPDDYQSARAASREFCEWLCGLMNRDEEMRREVDAAMRKPGGAS